MHVFNEQITQGMFPLWTLTEVNRFVDVFLRCPQETIKQITLD